MYLRQNYHRIVFPLAFLLYTLFSYPLLAQDTTRSSEKSSVFSIQQGTILTGFSVEGITASRDDFNHEFERSFSRLRFSVDGMYFVSDRIGLGPVIGYEYQYQDFEDPSGFFNPSDRWNWSLLYGAKIGWYVPFKRLFATNALGESRVLQNAHLFVNGGVNWLWTRQKIESRGKLEPENRFGYQLGAGVLVPVGKRISLEWKLGWEARRKNYQYGVIRNGQVIREFDETRWLKEFSIGLGLKVLF